MSLNPNTTNASTWYDKGNIFVNKGKYNEAIECYEAIKIDPNDTDAWNNKGVALANLRKQEDAYQCFARARELHQLLKVVTITLSKSNHNLLVRSGC